MEQKIDNKHIMKYILKAILYIAFLWFIYDVFLIMPDVILALFYSILPENLTVSEDFNKINLYMQDFNFDLGVKRKSIHCFQLSPKPKRAECQILL